MSAAAVSPGSLIDRDAYPVDAVGASARAALVEHCRAQLAANGACELPGFVTPAATARMVAESDTLAPVAHHAEGPITIYLDVADPQLPEDHPRRWLGRSSLAAVAYDLIPKSHALRALFEWDPLMEFLADVLGHARLYRYADPFGALNVAVMRDGDELAWHFDQTDFVVSIALRDADGPSYRVGFENFYVITRYNRSRMYASSVWSLAYALRVVLTKPAKAS